MAAPGAGSGGEPPMPRDAVAIQDILKAAGVQKHDPKVINQLLEFSHRYIRQVLEDAQDYKEHAGKASMDLEDLQLAIESRTASSWASPPPRQVLAALAQQRNRVPLPIVPTRPGVLLPPDKFCLTAQTYQVLSEKETKEARTAAASSGSTAGVAAGVGTGAGSSSSSSGAAGAASGSGVAPMQLDR